MMAGHLKSSIFTLLILLIFVATAQGQQIDNNTSPAKYPKKYAGDNLTKVIEKMRALSKKATKKGEFETTDEYISRLKKITESNRMEKDIVFVFRPRKPELEYDADKRLLTISIKNYDYDDNYENFILKDTRRITGSYVSTNGFGAKVRVTKIDQNLIRLQHNAEEKFKDTGKSSFELGMDNIYVLISPETAKKILSNIAVAYTASPVPHYYESEIQNFGPSFKDPRDVSLKKQTLYVEFKKITIFNYLSGEIYGELRVNEQVDGILNKYNECKTTHDSYECRKLLDKRVLKLEI